MNAFIYLIMFFVILLFLLAPQVLNEFVVPRIMPDHDLSDLRAGPAATEWRHSYACDKCNSPVGHEEFRTRVCLTCGRHMRDFVPSRAFRRVVRDGRWVEHQSLSEGDGLLKLEDGVWVPPEVYDKKIKMMEGGK